MTTEQLTISLRRRFAEGLSVLPLSDDEWMIQTPLVDSSGDPINIAISRRNGSFSFDDTGAIAGHLFSLGQHTQDTPAFKLLADLADAYSLTVDFDEGVVRASSDFDGSLDAFVDLTKVIVTLLTSTAHMRVRPRRLRILGPRLRSRIKRGYQQAKILALVEPDYELPGMVENWPVDFHWQVSGNDHSEPHNVYVVAADLNVLEPLRKAERLSALAIDTREITHGNHLRVVIDTHGESSATSKEAEELFTETEEPFIGSSSETSRAAQFIRGYSDRLGYTVFDFGDETQRQRFMSQSAEELLGPDGLHWREFWTRSNGSA